MAEVSRSVARSSLRSPPAVAGTCRRLNVEMLVAASHQQFVSAGVADDPVRMRGLAGPLRVFRLPDDFDHTDDGGLTVLVLLPDVLDSAHARVAGSDADRGRLTPAICSKPYSGYCGRTGRRIGLWLKMLRVPNKMITCGA